MPDFPTTLFAPAQPALSSFGPTCLAWDAGFSTGNNGNGVVAWPTSSTGIFVPVWIEQPATVYQMAIIVGTQSGNVDVGIYDINGNRLVRAGSTAVGATGVQTFNLTDTPLLPGTYYLAMAADNTTATFRASGGGAAVLLRASGVQTMANAFSTGLVDPVTLVGTVATYLPLITASLVSTI